MEQIIFGEAEFYAMLTIVVALFGATVAGECGLRKTTKVLVVVACLFAVPLLAKVWLALVL